MRDRKWGRKRRLSNDDCSCKAEKKKKGNYIKTNNNHLEIL